MRNNFSVEKVIEETSIRWKEQNVFDAMEKVPLLCQVKHSSIAPVSIFGK